MEKLKSYAAKYEGNQGDLAKYLEISRPHLSLLLAGKKQPSLELAYRIERLTEGDVPMNSWVPFDISEQVAS